MPLYSNGLGIQIARKGSAQQKPILGSVLDFSHPLAKGLVGCWLFNGEYKNLVNFEVISPSSGDITDYSGYLPAAAGGLSTKSINFPLVDGKQTFVFSGGINATTPNEQVICAKADKWKFVWRGQFGDTLGHVTWMRWPTSGTNYTTRTTPEGSVKYKSDSSVVFIPNNGLTKVWVNGSLVSLSGATWGPPYIDDTTVDMTIGNISVGGSSGLTRSLQYLYIYNKALSQNEASWLYQEPYAMILPQGPRRFYYIPPIFPHFPRIRIGI